MKKNAMLKIAAVLLVAVLLTTCAISSTFAKYTSEGGAYKDEARVARWGVEAKSAITNKNNGAFAASYGSSADKKYVKSSEDGVNVIAPGTTGSFTLDFTVALKEAGKLPEVSLSIDILDKDGEKANYIYISDSTLKGKIDFYVSENGGTAQLMNLDTINQKIAGWSVTYVPGETFPSEAHKLEITWIWEFEEGTTPDAAADATDTALGNDANDMITIDINFDIVQTGPASGEAAK